MNKKYSNAEAKKLFLFHNTEKIYTYMYMDYVHVHSQQFKINPNPKTPTPSPTFTLQNIIIIYFAYKSS